LTIINIPPAPFKGGDGTVNIHEKLFRQTLIITIIMEVLEEVEVGLEEDLLYSDEYADEINRRIAEIKVAPEIGIPFEDVCAEIRQAYGF
jgi:hypothetical protein